MTADLYEKRVQVRALKFQGYPPSDPNHMNDVMAFVQVPISLDFRPVGIILRVIINSLNVLEVPVGDYVVKDVAGKLTHMTKAAFEAEYTKVTD
ncbi:hypothetical protein BK131_04530 [Paenibacillus amylolyticus]|uniref:Uncharacterized protein n=1 Tax=Paenibacillus amylolyticus TaxID=1451 RepID=A0A1R1C548_PAEAM|nr:hypothetical protein [Paenibacillus amylolyticus]OMF17236.1 hypothetical protein BK131_04530 [Paenibacillus amylolyticus]